MKTSLLCLFLLTTAALAPAQDSIRVAAETYTLPNGMTVVLHEDHALPKVVINTWFAVGSKDEEPGRSGFAHLFEHLMFTGTERAPDDQFDVVMERAGGSNNASTNNDRTNYYSLGPSSLLPTLLWLDADRLDALADHMTQDKLDRQRAVVRNERRQGAENTPYGKARLLLPEALYPPAHPYHHAVIGSHDDLEAATLEDVIDFFHEYYVPANACLVVAGDFETDAVKAIIETTFGAIAARPAPPHRSAPRAKLAREKRIVDVDDVEFGKLFLAWHSPAHHAPGDAEMDLTSIILADGPSSRLEKRLVIEGGLAQSVSAYQASRELGSTFHVEVLAAPGVDLEAIKRAVLDVLEEYARSGPLDAELARAQARHETRFRRGMENLLTRAERMNSYRHYYGSADGFQRDLDRFAGASGASVARWAQDVFGPGRVDLRILPEGASTESASLDERPADFAPTAFTAPVPETLVLANGIPLHVLVRPGAGLFSGALLVRGGAGLIPPEKAGLATLTASLLNSGAGGLDKAAFAEAVQTLGATVRATAGRHWMEIGVDGLTSRLDATLDRFADVALRPNLETDDFEREKKLALAGIRSREDDPQAVSGVVARILLFGPEDPRGRPLAGFAASASALALEDATRVLGALLDPANAAFVFAGDVDPEALREELNERFGGWKSRGDPTRVPELTPLVEPAPGRIVLVDRPAATQTVITILRPLGALDEPGRAALLCADTIFGGTFTSRLNANLREDKGYTYGARSRVMEEGGQRMLYAGSAVRTDATGASMRELEKEFERMRANGIDETELPKATKTLRRRLVETSETTERLARSLATHVRGDRPLDAIQRDLDALRVVDVAAVNRHAKGNTFEWDDLLIVLVGDRETVLPQLLDAGFGDPVEADAEGRIKP